MIQGLGSCHAGKGELGLFSLEKRKLRVDLIIFQFLKCGYKEDGTSLYTRSHMEMMRRNGHKLLLRRLIRHRKKVCHNEYIQPYQ